MKRILLASLVLGLLIFTSCGATTTVTYTYPTPHDNTTYTTTPASTTATTAPSATKTTAPSITTRTTTATTKTTTATTTKATAAGGQFVGSVNSDKYHYTSCTWAGKISATNKVWFDSSADARGAGYVPCKVCSPP